KISNRHITAQALTEDNQMNSRQRYKAKRAAEHRERKEYCKRIDRAFSRLSEDCSDRVIKAINSTEYKMNLRSKPEPDYGSPCLPEVAMYAAGHRKSERVTAR
ncbi:transcriptional regulator, partial [Escherichia coli]